MTDLIVKRRNGGVYGVTYTLESKDGTSVVDGQGRTRSWKTAAGAHKYMNTLMNLDNA